MPIPFIVGAIGAAVAVGGTALVGSAAREVNENLANDLNRINRDIETMQVEANALVDKTKNDFEKSAKQLEEIEQKVVQETLKDFHNIIKEIKESKYFDNYTAPEYRLLNQKINHCFNNSVYVSDITSVNSAGVVLNFGLGLIQGMFFGMGAIKGVSLMCKIDDAIAEKKKLKAECKKIEIQCRELQASSEYMNTTRETLKTLKRIADLMNKETKELLQKEVQKKKLLGESEISQIMTMCNFNMALNDIINTRVVNEDGKINDTFRQRLDLAQLQIDSAK